MSAVIRWNHRDGQREYKVRRETGLPAYARHIPLNMRAPRNIVFATLISSAVAAVASGWTTTTQSHAAPTAVIKNGTVIGSTDGTHNVDNFMGIPYAIQPTGTLRLTNPSPMTTGFGTIVATGVPTACPGYIVSSGSPANLTSAVNSVFGSNATTGENCLNLNVQRSTGGRT